MKALFASGLGIILFYLFLAGAIYALQAFPYTGVILMLFVAPFWIGILVHVLMLHLAVMAVPGWISRAWLLIPALYYAGGYALHLESVSRAEAQAAEIERANRQTTAKAAQPFTYLFRYSHEDELFVRYQVERAYITESDKTFTQFDYARGEECDKANKVWDHRRREEPYLRQPDLFPGFKGPDKVRQCVITRNVPSGEWRYRLESAKFTSGDWLSSATGVQWHVLDASSGERVASARSAAIAVLPPVQTPVVGCTLISSAAAWKCFARLMAAPERITVGYKRRVLRKGENPFTPSNDPETEPISALGRALSLEPRRPGLSAGSR
jgi:hypothetical protein